MTTKRQRPHPARIISGALLLISLCQCSQAHPTLKQVHVITRHGSRHPLSKDAMTLEEETSETSLLTPIGQQQHYQLGVWLKERYETDFPNVLKEYSPNQVYLESSAYERTLVSASSLALGLFPASTRGLQLIPETPPTIPVYSHARHNDLTIRAYDKCPVFLGNLETLYKSPAFLKMEDEASELLVRLAKIPRFKPWIQHRATRIIPLKNIWNVYDAIQVAKTECSSSDHNMNDPSNVCQDLPDPSLATSISEDDWKQIQELAHKVEVSRYGTIAAHSLVGGPLWNAILQRMQSVDLTLVEQQQQQQHPLLANRLFVTSAHYPTLLGLFAALGVDFAEGIPEYASALIVEVYQDDDTWDRTVKLWYKSGNSLEATKVKFHDSCRTDYETGCSLDTFAQLLQDRVVLTPQQWCRACQNTKADVCVEQERVKLEESCSSKSNNNQKMAPIFFAGMLTMASIVLIGSTLCSRRRKRDYHGDAATCGGDVTSNSSNEDVKTPVEDIVAANGHVLMMNGGERQCVSPSSDGEMA